MRRDSVTVRLRRTAAPLAVLAALAVLATTLFAQATEPKGRYFPPPDRWETRPAAEVGMDPATLQEALDFALAHGSTWDFARDQVRTFGRPLGPVPTQRAATNGVIVRHGYLVAQFGDVHGQDPVYSVAKSFLSTVAGVAFDREKIRSVDDPVAQSVTDGGYDSPHNAAVTWKHHLQQTSEWEGTLWGKNADFVGIDEFGAGEREARPLEPPGSRYEYNDVRVNRLALSLLRVLGTGLPDVLKEAVMDPIGASSDWRWVPYDNSEVEIGGRRISSVSGGTRWGGGLWMHSEDLARFGLLFLNRGNWAGKQIVSSKWIADAVRPGDSGRDYGYLWWLNTQKQQWPSAPASSFAALGNGSNTIWIDPEHDLVLVWRWHQDRALDPMIQRILAAVVAE